MTGAARVREGARQVMAWLHGWIGLLLGWLLFAMCLAGTLAMFRPEISRWARPETIATADPVTATARTVAWLERHAGDAPAWYLTPPSPRANTVDATWSAGRDFVRYAFDPVAGAPVPRDTLGGEFFYRLHFDLQLPYPWGRLLASLAAMAMLVALITGIIAHARIFRDFFTFRPGRGQRAWLDAHNALGVLSLPFHLMITLTGLVTLATVSMPWAITANYGRDSARMFAEFTPGGIERPMTSRRVPLAPIAPMLRAAERQFGAPIGLVTVEHPGDATAIVTVTRADRDSATRIGQQIRFDGATGRPLTAWIERGRPAVAAYNALDGLHMAHFARPLLRWLYALGGAMLTGAVATGLVLWIAKRCAKAPLSRGERVVERVNVGMIAGTMLAFVGFFVANRLIPAGAPGRPDAEVAWVFRLWGLALVAALALPPRRGWPLLLGTASAAALAVPLLGWRVPGASLAATLARGDLAVAGVDLALLAAGFGLGWAAHCAARARPAVKTRSPRTVPVETVAA